MIGGTRDPSAPSGPTPAVSKTQIRNLSGRNKDGRTVELLLEPLLRAGLVIKDVDAATGGRPADIYRAATPEQ
jgi:predicted transcriptional regulator